MRDRAASRRALVLMHRFSVESTAVAEQTLGTITSNAGLRMLLVLAEHPDRSPSELAEVLGLSRSVISRLVGAAIRESVVERRTDPHDHRVQHLRLTPRGSAHIRDFERQLDGYFLEARPIVKDILLSLGLDPPVPHADSSTGVERVHRMGIAGSAYAAYVQEAMERFGVRGSDDRYALVLLEEHGQLRPTQLTELLRISRSATTDLLDRLVLVDLVSRQHDRVDADRRAVVVALTPRGRRAVTVLIEAVDAHADDLGAALAETLAE